MSFVSVAHGHNARAQSCNALPHIEAEDPTRVYKTFGLELWTREKYYQEETASLHLSSVMSRSIGSKQLEEILSIDA